MILTVIVFKNLGGLEFNIIFFCYIFRTINHVGNIKVKMQQTFCVFVQLSLLISLNWMPEINSLSVNTTISIVY